MGLINLYILSSIPVTIEGIKSFLKPKKFMLATGFSDNLEKSFTHIKEKSPDVLFIDDIGYDPLELDMFINEIFKRMSGIRLIVYTGNNDAVYLKNLVRKGIRGIINHKASREKIAEAIELIDSGGVYIDNNITFSIFSYDITQGIQEENGITHLSRREKELLVLIADGIKNKEIAELLFIAQRTVESHKSHLLKKLNLRSTTELTIFAVSNKEEIKRLIDSQAKDNV
ncbi:MAG: response regulator transcription factor [Ignavibacteriaceae bacterium]